LYLSRPWVIAAQEQDTVEDLVRELNISRPAAAVLANRGITTAVAAERFMNPDLIDLANPFLLPDIEKGVERISLAIDRKEKILVYGDRDADGVTSICVMVNTLRSLGAEPFWFIPSNEGYGLHREIIDRYAAQDIKLMITVDCGISGFDETTYANTKGIDVVITDHHEPQPAGLPPALAVIDPKRKDSQYPYTEIAGCVVAFKVAEALMLTYGKYYNEEMVVLDLETTGLEFDKAEICEFGAVKIRNGVIIDKFSSFARPEMNIPKEITGINGITDEMVAAAPPVQEVLKQFLDFIGARRLIMHNAEFDLSFLKYYAKKYLDVEVKNHFLDTYLLAKTYFTAESYALPSLVKTLKLGMTKFHRAFDDVLATHALYLKIEQAADLRMKFFTETHLDVLTLGTIADIMPLTGENRIIVKEGLKQLSVSRKAGVQALVERCSSSNRANALTSKFVSWSVTPVLNAAGRRGKADVAAELLLSVEPYKAQKLVDEIVKLNSERRELQAENMEKFLPLLMEQCDVDNDRIFVVVASGVEHGVTGIIASQISRQHNRPVILLIIEDGEAMGAARSIEGFDIVAALDKVSDILIKYGGHAQAAGLTISVDKIEEFRARIKEIGAELITAELMLSTVKIDAEVNSSEVGVQLIEEMYEMEPFGAGNPYPIFCLTKMKMLECNKLGDNHIKLKLGKNGGPQLTAVGWGLGRLVEELEGFPVVDIAFNLELNSWKEKKTVQLVIVDVKPSEL
jgi:single-stranded-DNA-specific exonuclease